MNTRDGGKPRLVAPKKDFGGKSRRGSRTALKGPAKKTGAGKKSGGKPKAKKRSEPLLVEATRWLLRLVWRMIWWTTFRITGLVVLSLGAIVGYYYVQLPPAMEQVDGRVRGSVTMLDKDGNVFAWRGAQFGGVITPANVAPALKNAVVATEDKRFYSHFGISPRGIISAIRINLREGRGPLQGNGGSTITQQVAKLLCLGHNFDPNSGITQTAFERECRRTTLLRKLNEVPFSLAMELKYTKDEILMIYLNRAYLGAGAHGFEAASQRYFGKSASGVNPAEAALMAGLLVAPSYYAPTRNLERANERASVVLGLMADQGYLTEEEAATARAHPAQLSQAAESLIGSYYADWIMDTGPAFLTKSTTEDVVIRTTFDPIAQRAAEDALTNVFEERLKEGSEAQAAIVVMSADGAVRAIVGGREGKIAGQFNRAVQAKRQTGSSFKPFVYAAALDLGYQFDSLVEDAPLTIRVPGSGNWSPKNYSGKFLGTVTLTEALAQSLNTAAVRVSEAVGRENVRKVAEQFGIASELDVGPAVALGTSETSLLEMTGAYAGILNGGTSVKPYGLEEVSLQGDNSPLMGKSGGLGERVISAKAARQLIYMMNQVTEIGSGRRARLPDRKIAGKTGTTQGARDAWFIGFTADHVVGVWMGYDDNSKLTGVTGGGLPAQIWKETMLRINTDIPPSPLPMIDPAEMPPATRHFIEGAAVAQTDDEPRSIIEDVLNSIFGRR